MNETTNEDGNALTIKDLYEQGSRCCQQYSQLTMQVRTLAQQVMIAYAVGIGLLIARGENLSVLYIRLVMCGAGSILIIFGVVLCFLNLHHSYAFRAIRDNCLLPLEANYAGRAGSMGPWHAHHDEREKHGFKSRLAWYLPFIALWLIGGLSFLAGMWLLPK